MVYRHFPVSELDNFTIGMCINYCMAWDRQQKRLNGEHVTDPEEQYQKLKAMEQDVERMHDAGQIPEARYKSFRQSIEQYERMEE